MDRAHWRLIYPRQSPCDPADSIHPVSQHRPAGYYSLAVRSLAFVSHGKNRHVPIPHLIRRCTQSASPLLLLALAVSAAGCHPPETRVHIRDFQHPGGPRSLHQNFDEAYYTIDPDGKLRLVLRNEAPSIAIPTENISQVLLIETFWRPIPGITFVESSMINANITYLIRSGPPHAPTKATASSPSKKTAARVSSPARSNPPTSDPQANSETPLPPSAAHTSTAPSAPQIDPTAPQTSSPRPATPPKPSIPSNSLPAHPLQFLVRNPELELQWPTKWHKQIRWKSRANGDRGLPLIITL